jgi:ABC-type transporter Mla MlaB component
MRRSVDSAGGNEGRATLRPLEAIDRSRVRALWAEANRLLKEQSPARLVIDLHDVGRIDGAGVALLRELEQRCRTSGVEFSVEGATESVEEFLKFVRGRSAGEPRRAASRRPSRRAAFKQTVTKWGRTLEDFFEFIGHFAKSVAYLATHPNRLRIGEVVFYIQS